MKGLIYASFMVGLAGYLLYTARYKISLTLFNSGALLPDEGGEGVGNGYADTENELRPHYVIEDGVGSSDFFNMGEGGVTGIRPLESFE